MTEVITNMYTSRVITHMYKTQITKCTRQDNKIVHSSKKKTCAQKTPLNYKYTCLRRTWKQIQICTIDSSINKQPKNKTKTKMSVKRLACLKVKGTASEKDRPCLVQL